MDFNSTFLHGDLHEETTWNSLLAMSRITLALSTTLRNIYGVKNAPQAWYSKMDGFLIETG
jgi:hypothetical protein